jgi:hypothetical protein
MRAFAVKLSRPEANTDGLVAPSVEPTSRTPPAKTATHRPAIHALRRSRVEPSLTRIGEPAPPGLPAGTGCAGEEGAVTTELFSRRAG